MSELGDIPLIGGIAETAIHGAEAVGSAVGGDWDGAANEAFQMSGSALHTVADDLTGGVAGVAEHVYDAAAPGLGLPTSTDVSNTLEGGLHDLGNALGDGVYNLVNGGDDSNGSGAPATDPGQDAGDQGGDYSGMDGGDMSGGDGSY